MRYIALILVCINAHADQALSLPRIDVGDGKYNEAVNKAAEATFIQTGVKTNVDKVSEKTTQFVATTIDSKTPLNSKHVFFAVGTSYAVFVKHQYSLSKSFRNPLFPTVTNTIEASKDRALIQWKYSW